MIQCVTLSKEVFGVAFEKISSIEQKIFARLDVRIIYSFNYLILKMVLVNYFTLNIKNIIKVFLYCSLEILLLLVNFCARKLRAIIGDTGPLEFGNMTGILVTSVNHKYSIDYSL